MEDKTHVLSVDSETKGQSANHDRQAPIQPRRGRLTDAQRKKSRAMRRDKERKKSNNFVPREPYLFPCMGTHFGVVRFCINSCLLKSLCQLLAVLGGQAVNEATLASQRRRAQKSSDEAHGTCLLGSDFQKQIWTVCAHAKFYAVYKTQQALYTSRQLRTTKHRQPVDG